MSEYKPFIPEVFPGQARPEPVVQMVLQAVYGQLMHAIKDELDGYVHNLAEQAILEFHHKDKDEMPYQPAAINDYLHDLADSPWIEATAADIAGDGYPHADIEMALKSILRASAARLDRAIRITTADAVSFVR